MNDSNKFNLLDNLKYDIPAGLVVFLVAFPLCLGIALASGAPAFSGIISGVIGGIIVTLFSGSQLGVSGPAAGLAVIVLNAINDFDHFPTFLLAVFIAGALQLLLGFMKAGIIGYYFPSSVIKGMLSGIGVVIILKQIPHAVGYDLDNEGDLEFFQPDGHTTITDLYYMLDMFSVGAVVIALCSLVILVLWERPFMKRMKFTQFVQGPLIVVGLGILFTLIFRSNPELSLKGKQLVEIPMASSFSEFLGQFTFPDFSQLLVLDKTGSILITAVTIAVVASLETLLCMEATDKLDPYKRISPTNRELKAQGIGNMVAGLIGGIPVTQVIIRSSANIQSGGRTKSSAFVHGVLLLVAVATIPQFLNLIPKASLAAILIVVGFKLAKPSLIKNMYALGWKQFTPYIITLMGIVFTDLLIGIGLGLVVAIFYVLYNNFKTPYFFDPSKHHDGEKIIIELGEDVSFINRAAILQTLNHLPDHTKVVINATRSVHIEHDIIELIMDFKENAKFRGIELELIDFPKQSTEHPVSHFVRVINPSDNQNKNSKKKKNNVSDEEAVEKIV